MARLTIAQFIALTDAGYSVDEIRAYNTDTPTPTPAPTENPTPAPTENPNPNPTPAPTPTENPTPTPAPADNTAAILNQILQAIQTGNINHSNSPGPTDPIDPAQYMAAILAPTPNK